MASLVLVREGWAFLVHGRSTGADREAQFAQAFVNVEKVLSAAGATFDDVVDMVTYHTDMRDLQLFIDVKDRCFTNLERLPTWTAIGVAALAMPGLCAEIKCTALLPD
jgi:enamine deaminase RidA (YjgF/YER057c/UK114 family)